MAINDKGHVTGQLHGPRIRSVGFLWKDGEMVSIGTPDDGSYGFCRSINNHGVIVGDVVTIDRAQHAMIVLDGQVQRLAPMVTNLGNWDLRTAMAVGEDGSIIGMGWLDGDLRSFRLVPIKRPG